MIRVSSIKVKAGPTTIAMVVPKTMTVGQIADWVESATGHRATRIVVDGVSRLRRRDHHGQ